MKRCQPTVNDKHKGEGGAKPVYVKFPDQPVMEVKSWTAVHTKAIEWLIDTGKISTDEQITIKRGWVLYTSDEEYAKKFSAHKKTGHGWFECNRSSENHIDDITKIFEHAGVDMDFKITIRLNEA